MRTGPFDQEGPDLPGVVSRYHREGRSGDAHAAMKAAVEARGGRWAVGGLVYTAERGMVGVEQAPGTLPAVDYDAVAARECAEADARLARTKGGKR